MIVVAALLTLDLGILQRKIRDVSLYEALALSAFWVTLGLSFAVVVYFIYEYKWFSESIHTEIDGVTAVTQYLTAYIVEESLSLDNLFVIALIFQAMKIPVGLQHRVLFWGILGAVVLRGLMIGLGVFLVREFIWMNYIFGGILLFSAVKLLADNQQPEIHPQPGTVVRLLQRFLPLTTDLSSGRFLISQNGKLAITPLFVTLLMVESADLLFAMDSIPAVIGISHDSFIIYSSNIFAILGLRALYFVIASAIRVLRFLRLTLVLILGFIGVKMLIAQYIEITPLISLLVISTLLTLGIITSLLVQHTPVVGDSPIGKARRNSFYEFTLGSLRRSRILVVGSSVTLVGVIMIVPPGPAILVIPAGLAILATEFLWARRLLQRFKDKLVYYSKETGERLKRKSSDKKDPS